MKENKTKAIHYIGIDPDVKKSGVCVWDARSRSIDRLECLSFFDLFRRLESIAEHKEHVQVIVDAGWLNKSNFHARAGMSHKANAIIGECTGANHETGKKIIEMCEYFGLPHELHRPTTSKVDADYFKKITGYCLTTNQEMRDAAMLVFGK